MIERRRELAPGRFQALAAGIHLDDRRALRARVLDQPCQPPVVALVDDRRVVGVRGEGGIERRDRLAHGGDEGVEAFFRDQRVVGRDAGLPGVEELAGDEPRRDEVEVRIVVDQRGALAAELQRDRDEVLRRGARDVAADRGRAGEEQVIELDRRRTRVPPRRRRAPRRTRPRRSAAATRSASSCDVRGVISEGLSSTRLPAASAPAAGSMASWNG